MALMRTEVEQWLRFARGESSTTSGDVWMVFSELCRFWLAHQWQPIETAPKDGSIIFVAHPQMARTARWSKIKKRWLITFYPGYSSTVCWQPTHWQPLPEPPLPHAKEDAKV